MQSYLEIKKNWNIYGMQKMYELVKTSIVENVFMENVLNIIKVKYYTWIEEVKLIVTASI